MIKLKQGIFGSAILLGSMVLTGCGTSGHPVATAPEHHSHAVSPSRATSSTTPSSRPVSAPSSPTSSTVSNASATTPSHGSATSPAVDTNPTETSQPSGFSVAVSAQGLPAGEYMLEPGNLRPEAPGMVWEYVSAGNFTLVLSNQHTTLAVPKTVSDVAVFNQSRQVLLDVYPVGTTQNLQLRKQGSAWVVQGRLPNGRYRIEYGNLIKNPNSTTSSWAWARLGSAKIITITQGKLPTTPFSAPNVVGAANPGFGIFNQQTNALVGFLSPTMNFSLN